jgi:hypothetical protein
MAPASAPSPNFDIPPDMCECAIQCPKSSHCACIFVHKEDTGTRSLPSQASPGCTCECSVGDPPAATLKAPRDVPLDALVNISIHDAELGWVGEFLNRMTSAELGIPASVVRTRVTRYMKRVRLGAAIQELGLVVLRDG